MKSVKFLTIAILIIGASALLSCKKKGCKDIDGDNYNSLAEKSGTCYYRYSKTLSTVSVTTQSSVNYDPFDAPDLYIKFAKSSSPNWDYSTSEFSNSYSFTANFADEFKFTNEQWDYVVYDYDTVDPDDLVCSGTFNPIKDGSDGNIVISNNGCVIKLPYSVKI